MLPAYAPQPPAPSPHSPPLLLPVGLLPRGFCGSVNTVLLSSKLGSKRETGAQTESAPRGPIKTFQPFPAPACPCPPPPPTGACSPVWARLTWRASCTGWDSVMGPAGAGVGWLAVQRTRQGAARRQDLLFGLQRPLEPPQPPLPRTRQLEQPGTERCPPRDCLPQPGRTCWESAEPWRRSPPQLWPWDLGLLRLEKQPFRGGGAPGGSVDGWMGGSQGALE